MKQHGNEQFLHKLSADEIIILQLEAESLSKQHQAALKEQFIRLGVGQN